MNALNYCEYSNEQIAKVVAYAVSQDCEKARRRFQDEYNMEPPPVRTIRNWKARFLETLSILPRYIHHHYH